MLLLLLIHTEAYVHLNNLLCATFFLSLTIVVDGVVLKIFHPLLIQFYYST